jgi:hypothetical protein
MLRAMTGEEVNEKVRRMTAVAAVPPEQCERLVAIARNLEDVDGVSSLAPLLVCQRSARNPAL